MQLQAKNFVAGVFTPPAGVPGGIEVTQAKLNLIWNEVTAMYQFRQLQLSPDRTGAVFQGSSQAESVVIQLPLVQVRDVVTLTMQQSAEKAETIMKIVARQLGVQQVFNLGIRLTYHAPIADNDARGFLMRAILKRDEEQVAELRVAGAVWGGVKLGSGDESQRYETVIEPLHSDPRFVFVETNAQFGGGAALDSVTARAKDVEQYVTHSVNRFLDQANPG